MALTEKDKAILQEMQGVANEYIALAKQYETHLNEEEWKQMEKMERCLIHLSQEYNKFGSFKVDFQMGNIQTLTDNVWTFIENNILTIELLDVHYNPVIIREELKSAFESSIKQGSTFILETRDNPVLAKCAQIVDKKAILWTERWKQLVNAIQSIFLDEFAGYEQKINSTVVLSIIKNIVESIKSFLENEMPNFALDVYDFCLNDLASCYTFNGLHTEEEAQQAKEAASIAAAGAYSNLIDSLSIQIKKNRSFPNDIQLWRAFDLACKDELISLMSQQNNVPSDSQIKLLFHLCIGDWCDATERESEKIRQMIASEEFDLEETTLGSILSFANSAIAGKAGFDWVGESIFSGVNLIVNGIKSWINSDNTIAQKLAAVADCMEQAVQYYQNSKNMDKAFSIFLSNLRANPTKDAFTELLNIRNYLNKFNTDLDKILAE